MNGIEHSAKDSFEIILIKFRFFINILLTELHVINQLVLSLLTSYLISEMVVHRE